MFDVKCNVQYIAYDIANRVGNLYLPRDNTPDLRSTVDSFAAIDPEVRAVLVYEEHTPKYVFFLSPETGEWEARLAPARAEAH